MRVSPYTPQFVFQDGTTFALDIQDIHDGIEKAIADYEFPYRDGALLEDMGERARRVRFRCYFYNESFASAWALLEKLNSQDILDFVHPEYGTLAGRIKRMDVRHDDRIRTAEIDIEFVEQLILTSAQQAALDVKGMAEASYAAGMQQQMQWFSDYVMQQMGPEGSKALSQTLDYTQPGVLSQIQNLTTNGRNFVAKVDKYVRTLDGTLSEVVSPANSLTTMINWGTQLPGRVIGSIAKAVTRMAALYNAAATAPARFLQNLKTGIDTLADASGEFGAQTQCGGAHALALQAGYLYDTDEQTYNTIKQQEGQNQKAFDTLGNYVGTAASANIMSANDYETTLALVRSYIEGVLETARTAGEDMTQLKAAALNLLRFAEQVKTERANVIQISVANPTPLHLICLQYGLDYHAAERVYAINSGIKNPSFTEGSLNIYAG